jgi:murein DD-endopeptidase MepM/ murein hydrolase activator NlpD
MIRLRRAAAASLMLLIAPAAPAAAQRTDPGRPALAAPGPFALDGAIEQGGLVRGRVPPGTLRLTLDGVPVPVAPDGAFLIAFDRDAAPAALIEAAMADGRILRQPLTVAARAWDISRLARLPKYPLPSAEFQRARPPELARIAAARARDTGAQGWRQRFAWPLTGRISTRFGSQRIYAGEPGAYHSGIDIARSTGTVVRAPADGVVVLAAATPFTLEGRLLMIDHGMGLSSAFLHLDRIDVAEGDSVRQGQPIGLVGTTGRSTGPHLHWGLMLRGVRIDPLLVAGTMPPAQ